MFVRRHSSSVGPKFGFGPRPSSWSILLTCICEQYQWCDSLFLLKPLFVLGIVFEQSSLFILRICCFTFWSSQFSAWDVCAVAQNHILAIQSFVFSAFHTAPGHSMVSAVRHQVSVSTVLQNVISLMDHSAYSVSTWLKFDCVLYSTLHTTTVASMAVKLEYRLACS